MKKQIGRLILCGSVFALASTATAQITYVDAQFNQNTFLAPSANGGVGGGLIATNTSDSVDGIWRYRAGFGLAPSTATPPSGNGAVINGGAGTVFESTGNTSPSDDVPRIVTSVSSLPLDTYNVFVYFWDDGTGAGWRLRAGLTDDVNPLPLFIGGGVPSGNPVPVQIATDNNGTPRRLWQVNLGQVTGTSISVFVEDGPATVNNERTWFDGIGYSAVPEPSSMALLGLGTLAATFLLRRRRN